MNERSIPEIGDVPIPANAPAQAGALLRAAREAQGLHIAALAVALKVPIKKLEALEAGHYSELPDLVFARSLALSVCRTLKVDPDQVLAALPGLSVHSIKPAIYGLNTEFKGTQTSAYSSIRAQLTSPLGLVAALFLLLTVAILFWRDPNTTFFNNNPPLESLEPVAQTPTQQIPVLPDQELPVPPAANENNAAVNDSALAESTQPAVLALKANGVSWIEVTDADGNVLLRKETSAGETLHISGKLPLSVIVGRADLIAVSVRGQAIDLAPLVRGNVARFEVK